MNTSFSPSMQWRSSSAMIFWGVLVLTLFGWIASILESIFSIMDYTYKIVAGVGQTLTFYGEKADTYIAFLNAHSTVASSMRVFEVLTLGGWVVYVVGLSQFKTAQITERGRWLAGSLNTACWLGLISMLCYFLAGFAGWLGLLLRFIGWILLLVSLFKFRGASGKLSYEQSWNERAQSGARNLRLSYTVAIILQFFPLICGMVVLFVGFGMIGNIGGLLSNGGMDSIDMIKEAIAGALGLILILGLTALVLWILQFINLLSGWKRIKNGGLVREKESETTSQEAPATEGIQTPVTRPVTEPIKERIENAFDDNDLPKSSGKQGWVIGSCIAGTLVVILTLWLCFGQKGQEATSLQTTTEAYSRPNSYKGTIDNQYEIEMTFKADGDAYFNGSYHYTKNNNAKPIQLRGRLINGHDHLILDEYVGDKKTGTFDGHLIRSSYRGTWTSANEKKQFPFNVTLN